MIIGLPLATQIYKNLILARYIKGVIGVKLSSRITPQLFFVLC